MVAHATEQLTRDIELLGDAHERVVGVGEEALDGRWEQLGASDLDAAVDDPAHGATRRRYGAPVAEQVVTKLGELRSGARGPLVVDPILERVDLGVERIE